MHKLSLAILAICLFNITPAYSYEEDYAEDAPRKTRTEILENVTALSNQCKSIIPTEDEQNEIMQSANAFALEPIYEQKRIDCLLEKIEDYATQNLGAERWETIERYLSYNKNNFLDIYRAVKCANWPDCLNSEKVYPYMYYYTFLENLLFDMYMSVEGELLQ